MARTRIDPWQAEQPDLLWKNSILSSITSKSTSLSLLSHDPLYSGSKTEFPKTISNVTNQLKPMPKSKSIDQHQSGSKSALFFSSDSKHLPLSRSSIKTNRNPFSKNAPKKTSRKFEFKAAASKVLAALNVSNVTGPFHKLSDFDYGVKLKKKRLGLPVGDKRSNMVPKVVLRDIASIISKVCPKLSVTSSCSKESQQLSPLASSNIFEVNLKPPDLKQKPTSLTIKEPVVINPNQPSLPEISPRKISKGIAMALTHSGRKSPSASSETSSTPAPIKQPSFADLASAAPSFQNSNVLHPTLTWPSCSKLLPSYPVESVSSMSSKSVSPPTKVQKSMSLELEKHNVISSKSDTFRVNVLNVLNPEELSDDCFILDTTRHTSRETEVSLDETESSRLSTRASLSTLSSNKSQSCSRHLKFSRPFPIKNGFLGFHQEDGKKLKVRFHVNTNILASSLDLLDLHKNAGMPSGSPSICSYCSIIFSSVKHCKYHQSFISSAVTSDVSRHNNIQEDGVWLCPWCPLMCTSIDLLNRHKLNCRDKGRCQPELKVSSLRKSAPNSSRRRCTPAVNGILTLANRYKVVHGQVIQL